MGRHDNLTLKCGRVSIAHVPHGTALENDNLKTFESVMGSSSRLIFYIKLTALENHHGRRIKY